MVLQNTIIKIPQHKMCKVALKETKINLKLVKCSLSGRQINLEVLDFPPKLYFFIEMAVRAGDEKRHQ